MPTFCETPSSSSAHPTKHTRNVCRRHCHAPQYKVSKKMSVRVKAQRALAALQTSTLGEGGGELGGMQALSLQRDVLPKLEVRCSRQPLLLAPVHSPRR